MTWLWQPRYVNTPQFTGVEVRPFTHSGMATLRDFIRQATEPSTDFPMHIPPEKLLVGLPWCTHAARSINRLSCVLCAYCCVLRAVCCKKLYRVCLAADWLTR